MLKRGLVRLLAFALIYIGYLCLGAVIFTAIEGPVEQSRVADIRKLRSEFLERHQCIDDDDLEVLIGHIIQASKMGVAATRNASGELNWSFGQSLFFSGTVVTTIGYGHVTPLSREGKAFCIIFAVFGIPFTLVLLSAFVERLLVPTLWFLQFLNSKLGHLYQAFNIRLMHLFFVLGFLIVFFLLIPAAIFARLEPDWDYLDSFYYCFISLTTIGLGDYIPGDSPDQPYRPLYKIVATCYLLCGVTFMMLTLAVFYDIPQLNIGVLFSHADDPQQSTEKMRLAGSGYGLQYGIDSANPGNTHHTQVVRVRSRQRDSSPSPEDNVTDINHVRLP
ncbi:PREDICTED: potassium channel subfamily K member 1-like isoform X2 [Nicrophorus vespilloides]|uniref:Potassium channel subfamily K member 1 n=1 Tax=Nicrophorus vespilloides TaxID=110193 RepID=A0ABM1MMH2_NICVS|nr:PREDICTED: potassium channel subfamily K member 1-like isoform X2 [Nicrophorus vespilloides]